MMDEMLESAFGCGILDEWNADKIAQWLAKQTDHTVIALSRISWVGGLKRYEVGFPQETERHYGMQLDYEWFALMESEETPIPFPVFMKFNQGNTERLRVAALDELYRRGIKLPG